jgi:hypothetical protein
MARRCEVKGSSMEIDTFELTINEVKHATAFTPIDLIVIDKIVPTTDPVTGEVIGATEWPAKGADQRDAALRGWAFLRQRRECLGNAKEHGGSAPGTRSSPRSDLQHCPTRRYLNGGNTPCVQHDEPVAMSGAQRTRIMGERGNDVLDNVVCVARRFVVRNVELSPADKPNPQHNLCHDHAP